MKKLIFLIVPLLLCADDLKELIEYATKYNNNIVSSKIVEKSKQKELESKQSAYYPTLDIGANYQNLNERSLMMPGDTYSGYAKVGLDIYDGGKKSSLENQKKSELRASGYDTSAEKKALSLDIVENFYAIASLNATLEARVKAQSSLLAQLQRMKAFYSANIATSDDVDRLQAAYDTNSYNMESIKLQIFSLKSLLELKVGKKIESFEKSNFMQTGDVSYEAKDEIKSLQETSSAIQSGAEALNSIYIPKLRVEDTFSSYGYGNYDETHPQGVDNQNRVFLTLSMRLYDNGTVKKEKEALMLSSNALKEKIDYLSKQQKALFNISKATVFTSKMKIDSSLSALKSSTSAFETIEQKYKAGIVDNVVYLDALTSKTESEALYATSLNDLEVAYASYYYYLGKNIEEFIQ